MVNKINMGKVKVLSYVFVFVMLVNFVAAYGVLSEFSGSRILAVAPGDTVETYLKVQNTAPEDLEDITVMVELTGGSEVASLRGSEYFVAKGQQVTIPVDVSVPLDASVGTEYTVSYSVRVVSPTEGEGTISFGVGYDGDITVRAEDQSVERGEQPAPGLMGGAMMWLVAAVVIVVIVVIVVASRRRHSSAGMSSNAE
jgi:uncharacterized membrane protein